MTVTRYPRPCPIPGHPQDDEPAPLAPDSAWSRLRAWHLHAPAERLPLPLALTWPAAWVASRRARPRPCRHLDRRSGRGVTWLRWRRHARTSPHPRLAATEAAMVAAAIGGWFAAAVTSGPLGWPAHLLSWIYLAGAVGGYRWLRRHPAVQAARKRRDDAAAWTARKAEWHRIAHRIGLGDFHLQSVTPDAAGRGAAADQRARAASWPPVWRRAAGRTRRSTRTCAACPTAGSTSGSPSTPGSWSSRSAKRTRRSTARSPTRR